MICPRCGSFISPGDAYCPGCGATFRIVDDEPFEDDNVSRLKIMAHLLIRDGEYKRALEAVSELEEYCDASELSDSLRDHYVEEIVNLMKDGEHGSANLLFGEYIDVFAEDMLFLGIVSVNARQYGNLGLLREIYYRMDMIDGGPSDDAGDYWMY